MYSDCPGIGIYLSLSLASMVLLLNLAIPLSKFTKEVLMVSSTTSSYEDMSYSAQLPWMCVKFIIPGSE